MILSVIPLETFYHAVQCFRPLPDENQRQAIEAGPNEPLFIVAGPGTGKTTCLTLRILKLVLVDGIPPHGILATTFTIKAAAELRSRVLGWGFRLLNVLASDPVLSDAQRTTLRTLDINQVRTGTIDSLCEQLLRDFRAPGTQPPVLADDFVAKTLLMREGLFADGRYQDSALDRMLLTLHSGNGSRFNYHTGTKANLLQEIWDRRFQDQVGWPAFLGESPEDERRARQEIGDVLAAYEMALAQRSMVDFALLEQEVLRRLRNKQLDEFLADLKVVLVDEYQDTNLLQESIYFDLAKACGGALAVVGDDDQSLYRFRGATVELFSNFGERYKGIFERKPSPVFLSSNYRSTRAIVRLVNDYATLDQGYQAVRVARKPPLDVPPNAREGMPILGLFRDTIDELAQGLATLIHDVFRGGGVRVPGGETLIRASNGGDVGDCALLCSSPAELASNGRPRLPLLLRQQLATRSPSIEIFNPRGQDLVNIPLVAQFGGLLLECLDPGGIIEAQTSGLAQDTTQVFQQWRSVAIAFTSDQNAPSGLLNYAIGWADRDPHRAGFVWPRSLSVLELIYGLVHYFPELHDDPEGQVYLEVFTRQLSACEQVGKFKGRVVTDTRDPELARASVKELLRDFLGPIAAGTIRVNEELLEAFPRDRLSVLSIHQSKGLEFPLTIVDVGSDFKDRHAARFKRFPNSGSTAERMEDLLRPYTPLGAPSRAQVDRAFDDLYRQFFVAFSRAQDVLLLVGVNATLPNGRVENVAIGWDRLGNRRWSPQRPFVLI